VVFLRPPGRRGLAGDYVRSPMHHLHPWTDGGRRQGAPHGPTLPPRPRSAPGAERPGRSFPGWNILGVIDPGAMVGYPGDMRRSKYGSARAVPKLRVQLAERLREVRRARGLSQTRVGELAGLSGKFIGEIERGDKSVSIDTLYRVAEVLKVSLRELLAEPNGKGALPPQIEEIYRLLARRSGRELRPAQAALGALFARSSRPTTR